MKSPLHAEKIKVDDEVLGEIIDIEFNIKEKIDFHLDSIKIVPCKSKSGRYTQLELTTIIAAEKILEKYNFNDISDKFSLGKAIREEFINALHEATQNDKHVFQAFIDRPKKKKRKDTKKKETEEKENVDEDLLKDLEEAKKKKPDSKPKKKKSKRKVEKKQDEVEEGNELELGEETIGDIKMQVAKPQIGGMKRNKITSKIKGDHNGVVTKEGGLYDTRSRFNS